jgi:hypothetical protein
MQTDKGIKVAKTNLSAAGTGLACHVGIYQDNLLSFSFSLVSNEGLQLEEAPVVEPSIQPFSHIPIPGFPYSFKVLKDNSVSTPDNLLAYIVVNPCHKTFLPAGKQPKMPFCRLCAFCLEFSTHISELDNLAFRGFEYLTIRADRKVVYAKVDTHCLVSRTSDVSISGECDVPEQGSFVVDKLKRLVIPAKVFPKVFRNLNWDVFSVILFEGCDTQLFARKVKKFLVPGDYLFFKDWPFLKLDTLEAFTCFAYCLDSKISRKHLSQILMNKMMQPKPVAYLGFKAFVNSTLDSASECFGHIDENIFLVSCLDFYRRDKPHADRRVTKLYKHSEVEC